MQIEVIIFYILLIDSLGANYIAWFDGAWYKSKFRPFAKLFPITKGWTTVYLILVIWIGFLI